MVCLWARTCCSWRGFVQVVVYLSEKPISRLHGDFFLSFYPHVPAACSAVLIGSQRHLASTIPKIWMSSQKPWSERWLRVFGYETPRCDCIAEIKQRGRADRRHGRYEWTIFLRSLFISSNSRAILNRHIYFMVAYLPDWFLQHCPQIGSVVSSTDPNNASLGNTLRALIGVMYL